LRGAYNWRDRFLTGTVAGSPIFSQSVGQFDASASYDVNDRFTVTFEAVNLNNVRNRTYQASEDRTLSYVQYGRQFLGGVRFRL
ncbi:MAG: TonB-dependent receptor, partial [Oxalobacteraceae bacterium]